LSDKIAPAAIDTSKIELTRYGILPLPFRIAVVTLVTAGIGLFVLYMFGWTIRGWVLEEVRYYYLLYVCFSTCVFLILPARKRDKKRLPWYDVALAAIVFSISTYFAANAYEIAIMGWVPPPSMLTLVLACVITVIGVEGGRRLAGWPFVVICLLMGVYPIFADRLPGVLYGFSFSFEHVIGMFAYGRIGMLGLPAQLTGTILIGFLVFAGVLMATGAGDFFLKISFALLGRYRGGPAKVAVLASGFFGSLSGVSVANIVATGSVTIPAMKRMGYPAHYAGAIEAVASSGGAIMPPVMGIIAFIMVILTGVPYSVIIGAALIPALLYYWGLIAQVDAYAAKVGLKGLPRAEIPPIGKTLLEGWSFILVLAFLVFGLIYMRWGSQAPLYATALLLALSMLRRQTRITPAKLIEILASTGNLIVYMVAILMPVGLILIGLQVTGSITALTAQIVAMAGSNVVLVLLIAVIACYLLGMVGQALIPYIVLSATAIPALVSATGLSLTGLHLFVIYYLLMAGITPPIAVAAFMAAAMADAPAMKTGFTAMRLAVVLYFIPFFFVFNPALILEGPIYETLYLFVLCVLGIGILAGGLEGYLLWVGRLPRWARPLIVAGGFCIALPGWLTTGIGAALVALIVLMLKYFRRRNVAPPIAAL